MELDEIFNAYYDRIYSFTLLRVGNVHNAENITSDVFLRVVEKLDTYDTKKAAFSTWIFTVALNEIRMFFRRRKLEYSLDAAGEVADQFDVEEDLLRKEERVLMYRAIEGLNDRQRDAILMKYFGGLTNRRIAEVMGLSETNVETILYRARNFLKKLLPTCEESVSRAYKETGKEEAVR